jgi:hypothetical protein
VPHFRLPAISPGVQAFIWAFVFALYIWAFSVAVGVDNAVAGIIGAVAGAAVFLLVRLYGEDLTRRRRPRRTRL